MERVERVPQNDLAGLHAHWRADLLAGCQVGVLSLVFSMAVAIASGAPPIAGLISAIVAGLIFPIVGGSYLIIGGPAAGLAPIIASGITHLGQGDALAGYSRVLAAIICAGLIQLLLSKLKLGLSFRKVPAVILNAMLTAIGIGIIVGQVPRLLGAEIRAHEHLIDLIRYLPEQTSYFRLEIVFVGIISLLVLYKARIIQEKFREVWFQKLFNPYALLLFVGIKGAGLVGLKGEDLVVLPVLGLECLTPPDFSAALTLPLTFIALILTVSFVDTAEAGMAVVASDDLDKRFQRTSDPNRALKTVGWSNVFAPWLGGLTVIPGPLKTTANAKAGGVTLWANAFSSLTLILLLAFGQGLIERVPYITLSVLLLNAGGSLITHGASREKLLGKWWHPLIYLAVISGALVWDLLIGILLGFLLYSTFYLWQKRQSLSVKLRRLFK